MIGLDKDSKEKLEEILRQLREEERKILLAALEARFQNMVVMQKAVLRGTVRIDQVTGDERSRKNLGCQQLYRCLFCWSWKGNR